MFCLFKRLFNCKSTTEQRGQALFELALAQAQLHGKQFFTELQPTEDTELRQQRFEVVALFMAALLWRLKQTPEAADTAQFAYDKMFTSFDRSLREAGVGDIGVAHRIKKFAQAFHGRLKTYGDALDAGDEKALDKALQHNIKLTDASISGIAAAAFGWAMALKAKDVADIK